MMYSNSASWFKEDGSLDSDSLKSYLNDIKAIYNAAYETLSDKDKSDMDQMKQYYTSDDYEIMDVSLYGSDPSSMAMYIMAGMNRIATAICPEQAAWGSRIHHEKGCRY